MMLNRGVRSLYGGLLDLIYPRVCLLCRFPLHHSEPTECLCPVCRNRIHHNRPAFCQKCSRPINRNGITQKISGNQNENFFCYHCQRHTLFFDRCWSATLYDDTMRQLLHLFKYGKNTGLRILFAELIADFVQRYHLPIHTCDLIVPVPLHRTRFRERGFNQSQLIAMILAKKFQIPCCPSMIVRTRHTINQARVNSKQRWTNMYGTFTIKHTYSLNSTNIIIVDDLLTTGATLSAIAWQLKKAGAHNVYGLTAAIAINK